MTLGYLMNAYPMVSTTFIGREIAALEAQGLTVRRYVIRPWHGTLVDPGDIAEQQKVSYLLTGPKSQLVFALLAEMFLNPRGAFRAVGLTLRLVRNARGGLVRHAAYLLEAMVLHRLGARDGITHLHAHFSTNSAAVAMLSQALGGPAYSFTMHGPDELLAPVENSTRLKISRACFVACISHFCRSQAMLFSDQADWAKLRIVHCGITPANYGRNPHGQFGQRVLFVGRLEAVKGVPLLLEAFAAVRNNHPDARLTIVGDGTARAALEAQARTLGIAELTEFLGYRAQSEVTALLDTADMLVLPSFAEGLPVVLMEALASLIPVIATQVAGVSELVEDGISGFIVPPGDVETLALRLDRLLSDPELCAAMGQAGRAKVEAEFDIRTEVEKLTELFKV